MKCILCKEREEIVLANWQFGGENGTWNYIPLCLGHNKDYIDEVEEVIDDIRNKLME